MSEMNSNSESGFTEHYSRVEHSEPVRVVMDFGPSGKNVIAKFKVRIKEGRKTSYVHAVKVFEREGQAAFHCSQFCGQGLSIRPEPCAAMRLGEKAVATVTDLPETQVCDLRRWLEAGGNLQELVAKVAA